jgi:DUF4097 and DUF4098 domain-containing protein YvlB
MKPARIRAIAALAAALWLAVPAAAAQRETETVDRSFPFGTNGHLKLRNFSGKITITGSNRANVVVHAVRRATRDRLDGIRLDIQASASEIEIDANKKESNWDDRENNVVETDFDIEVPQGTSLDVQAFSSDVHVRGVEAKQRLHTFSGEITVDDAAGPLDVETFSGDIAVDLTAAARGHVEFNSFSGSLDTDLPMTSRGGRKRNISGDIGGGGDIAFNFKTFSGDVRIK